MLYTFKMDEFVKSLPSENVQYITSLQQTQGLFSSLTLSDISNRHSVQ